MPHLNGATMSTTMYFACKGTNNILSRKPTLHNKGSLYHHDECGERGAVVINKLSVRAGIADAHVRAGRRAERWTVLNDLALGIVYGDTMYIGSASEATSPRRKACDATRPVTGVKHLRLLLLQEEDT